MAKFRVDSIEARADAQVACDTFVLIEVEEEGVTVDKVVGHFTVILNAAIVNQITGTKPQRIAQYKALFAGDRRIAGIIDSEAAVAKIGADIAFPVEVTV